MKSILTPAVLAATFLAVTAFGQATPTDDTDGQPTVSPAAGLTMRTPKSLGCYSGPGDMIDMGPYTFQAMGWCGGTNNWAIYSDGFQNGDPTGLVQINVPTQTPPAAVDVSSPTTSSQIYATTAVITQSGGKTVQTVVMVTETAPAQAAPSASTGGPNKVAIAVGVVVAVIGVAIVIGALFFWMRYRKNKAIEEERRRHQMMTNLVTGEKPGSSYSLGDSRLDQGVMFQRRQSDGSIADNEDYSRRILKVSTETFKDTVRG
ncbi:MAG: hypothetical protein LQ340_005057 [Diploschistes diacapsis]|nr:MAG: hypothetical protein LQ340_005057 [Diploschistes diacapsis]